MNDKKIVFRKIVMCLAVCITFGFLSAGIGSALDLVIEPANTHREIGDLVRVHVYADLATDIISFGAKVSFDPNVLQVQSAEKNTDLVTGFIMDADGLPGGEQYTTPPVEFNNTEGWITMLGGRLTGNSTVGLSGKVLLGWIVFVADALGESALTIDLAQPIPTFVNFADTSGNQLDPVNLPQSIGSICVVANACYADTDGDNDADMTDALNFRNAFPSNFPSPNYNPSADFDGDGDIDQTDALSFRNGFPRTDCPVCQ